MREEKGHSLEVFFFFLCEKRNYVWVTTHWRRKGVDRRALIASTARRLGEIPQQKRTNCTLLLFFFLWGLQKHVSISTLAAKEPHVLCLQFPSCPH
jgi:hypothetical protein